jgi:hypothetical protein
MQKKVRIALLLVLTVILCVGLLIWTLDRKSVELIGSDFAGYWSSGHILLQGGNPYSVENLLAIELSLNLPQKEPVLIYNPPWVLTFLLPFSILEFSLSKLIWLACILALIFYCADRLWLIYGGHKEARIWSLLVVATFTPMLIAFKLGQIIPFMFLGLVGFLHFAKLKQWWLVGIVTIFIAVKPHTLYLFWFALLLWAMKHRLWQVLLGSALAILCVTMPTLFYNPSVFNQYFSEIVLKSFPTYWATPTFGTFLRLLFGREKEWLQYIPTLAGLIWFIFYWRVHRDCWIWENELHILIIISLITNFYCWQFDYCIILPTVIQGAIWVQQKTGVCNRGWIVLFYIITNVAAFISTHFLYPFLFLWMPFALWINFILLKNQRA